MSNTNCFIVLCLFSLCCEANAGTLALYQAASTLSYADISKVVERLEIKKEDCNSSYLHSLMAKLSKLQQEGVITFDQKRALRSPLVKQVEQCRKNRLLHR